jgi:hypothetical protein
MSAHDHADFTVQRGVNNARGCALTRNRTANEYVVSTTTRAPLGANFFNSRSSICHNFIFGDSFVGGADCFDGFSRAAAGFVAIDFIVQRSPEFDFLNVWQLADGVKDLLES